MHIIFSSYKSIEIIALISTLSSHAITKLHSNPTTWKNKFEDHKLQANHKQKSQRGQKRKTREKETLNLFNETNITEGSKHRTNNNQSNKNKRDQTKRKMDPRRRQEQPALQEVGGSFWRSLSSFKIRFDAIS